MTGSIPARAGEPHDVPCGDDQAEVYPRPCGGAADVGGNHNSDDGLSPPVRGSLPRGDRERFKRRSIPARAGEPDHGVLLSVAIPVYPRPCGGATFLACSCPLL